MNRIVLGCFVAGTALAVAGLTRFEVDPDVSSMLPADSRVSALLSTPSVSEGASRSVYVMLHGSDLESRIPDLEANLEASPLIARVDATLRELGAPGDASKLPAPIWNLDEPGLVALEARLSPAGMQRAVDELRAQIAVDPLTGRETALRDPLGLRWTFAEAIARQIPRGLNPESSYLISRSGNSAIVRVVGTSDPFDIEYSNAVLRLITESLDGQAHEVLGSYAIASSDAERIKTDLKRSLSSSIPLVLLFLTLSLGSWLTPHLLLLPSALAVLWALGLGGLVLGPLSPLAISSAAILIGLGIDYSIHFYGRYSESAGQVEYTQAVEETRRSLFRPLLGGTLTTAAAFLSTSFGTIPGLRSLGVLLAFGLICALLATWFLLPVTLKHTGVTSKKLRTPRAVRLARRASDSRFGATFAFGVLATGLLGWALAGAVGLRFEADPSHMRPETSATVEALQAFESAIGLSPNPVMLLTPAATDPGEIRASVASLISDGTIGFASGAIDSSQSAIRKNRIDKLRTTIGDWTSNFERALSQGGFRADPFQVGISDWERLLAEDPPRADEQPHLTIEWDGESYWKTELFPHTTIKEADARRELEAHIQALAPERSVVLSPHSLGDIVAPAVRSELKTALVTCFLAVILLVVATIRSIRHAVVALLPAICGLGASVGLLASLGVPIHPGNLLALPLILGLGVDDGVHMVMRAREGKGDGDAILTTGAQIWRTTITTSIGFGSLATAASPGIASLGLLALVGAMMCFMASVLLVPHAFRWASRNSSASL